MNDWLDYGPLCQVRDQLVLSGKVLKGIIEADVVDEVTDDDMNNAALGTGPAIWAVGLVAAVLADQERELGIAIEILEREGLASEFRRRAYPNLYN